MGIRSTTMIFLQMFQPNRTCVIQRWFDVRWLVAQTAFQTDHFKPMSLQTFHQPKHSSSIYVVLVVCHLPQLAVDESSNKSWPCTTVRILLLVDTSGGMLSARAPIVRKVSHFARLWEQKTLEEICHAASDCFLSVL